MFAVSLGSVFVGALHSPSTYNLTLLLDGCCGCSGRFYGELGGVLRLFPVFWLSWLSVLMVVLQGLLIFVG